jgi:protein-disulfide isomerase-like protein with CxxC motif
MTSNRPGQPVVLDAFVDFHCPFSYRIVAWLDDLGPERVTVRHHLLAIEQLNRDPTGTQWRLWDQPFDYRHFRDMPDRRPLLPFLAMAIVEAIEPPTVIRAVRLSMYMARFDFGKDLSDIEVIEQVAAMGGVAPRRLRAAIEDPVRQAEARSRIESDFRLARSDYAVFGVPTLRFAGDRPVYIRLERMVRFEDGPPLLDTIRAVRASPPGILELKLPEPLGPIEPKGR